MLKEWASCLFMLNDSGKIWRVEKVCLNLNLRMFLKVQGGLKKKLKKNRVLEIHSAEYVYDANEENLSGIFPE